MLELNSFEIILWLPYMPIVACTIISPQDNGRPPHDSSPTPRQSLPSSTRRQAEATDTPSRNSLPSSLPCCTASGTQYTYSHPSPWYRCWGARGCTETVWSESCSCTDGVAVARGEGHNAQVADFNGIGVAS